MLHHPVSFCTCIRFKVQAVLKCFVRKHSVLSTNVAYVVCQCHAASWQHESRVLWSTSNLGRGSAWKGYGKRCRKTLEDYREAGRNFEAAWFTGRAFSKCVGHHRTLLHSPVGTVVVFCRKRHLDTFAAPQCHSVTSIFQVFRIFEMDTLTSYHLHIRLRQSLLLIWESLLTQFNLRNYKVFLCRSL